LSTGSASQPSSALLSKDLSLPEAVSPATYLLDPVNAVYETIHGKILKYSYYKTGAKPETTGETTIPNPRVRVARFQDVA